MKLHRRIHSCALTTQAKYEPRYGLIASLLAWDTGHGALGHARHGTCPEDLALEQDSTSKVQGRKGGSSQPLIYLCQRLKGNTGTKGESVVASRRSMYVE